MTARKSQPETTPRRVLALTPPDSVGGLERAANAADVTVVLAGSISDLFARLAAEPWAASLVSLGDEAVDEVILQRIAAHEHAGVVMLSADRVTLERALLMERVGAAEILREPLDETTLEPRLRGLAEVDPNVRIPKAEGSTPRLVGDSPALAESLLTLARAASSSATVLVTGESGSGKELVARSLHNASSRAKGPFVAVNCAAIPEQLLESELFGHERGAFTGAVARKKGRFELAEGGTLFLDEIGDMSAVLQAKMLRVLEDGTIQRLGSEETLRTDVRIVAATNKDLFEMTRQGGFREDLYHRLAVVEIRLPPLRERKTDIRELALYFTARAVERHGRAVRQISTEALRRLEDYPWPGNVRELRNVMDRAVVLSTGPTLRPSDLRLGPDAPHASPRREAESGSGFPPSLSLAEVEAAHIRAALRHFDGHIANTADSLGIHRNTLARKMQELGISP